MKPLSPHRYLVDEETGCWVWQRATTAGGYGVVWKDGGLRYAHRTYYEQHVNPIGDGLQLDHLCRNRACVNPAHLEPVTQQENIMRGSRIRLTDEDVAGIRASDDVTLALAAQHGVTPRHINNIRCGKARPALKAESRMGS